ncbi:3-oxoacyl-reductase [Lepidopterella palustris CBS 459.81]|uniref:3-oxoacyl-reductase n=1 Tax=Lepidopterella palustris CBS 459.81 TaxID=1314670 RepID=A0A8E2ELP6_9PEZI|nr:3-oxoacyl-reductase [Lepidopterella palustris CBS 459.81]
MGLATAKILVSRDVDAKALAAAQKEFEGQDADIMFTKVDISKRIEVEGWIKSTIEHFGQLIGVANCAGILGTENAFRPLSDLEDDAWDRIIGVNHTGTMYCLRAEIKNIVDGGSIVSISSVSGLEGMSNLTAYSASKHGVIRLTRAAAKEVGTRKIRVNTVAPGIIRTLLTLKKQDSNKTEFPPAGVLGRHGEAEKVASILVWLLGPESTFVTGAVYTVDGGWHC